MTTPIQTQYNGLHFRSRLEARWAVFFDTAGIDYRYEVEGFTAWNGTRYLPDFYLPDTGTWVEVKGGFGAEEFRKLQTVCDFGGLPGMRDALGTAAGLLLLGDIPALTPGYHPTHALFGHRKGVGIGRARFHDFGSGVRPSLTGLSDELGYWCEPIEQRTDVLDAIANPRPMVSSNPMRPQIAEAYRAARSCRFEFGETPRAARA